MVHDARRIVARKRGGDDFDGFRNGFLQQKFSGKNIACKIGRPGKGLSRRRAAYGRYNNPFKRVDVLVRRCTLFLFRCNAAAGTSITVHTGRDCFSHPRDKSDTYSGDIAEPVRRPESKAKSPALTPGFLRVDVQGPLVPNGRSRDA